MSLSSGKIDKYEYLTGEKILPSDEMLLIEQAKLEKQAEKQVDVVKSIGASNKLKRI